MQVDGLAFDQQRLERLNAETMQRRRTVQQHRMFLDALFERIPDLGLLALDHLLGGLDGRGNAKTLQAREHERLEQRSEEHTSELQSLMRISYAVFCLKKKTLINKINYIQTKHQY